VGLDGVRETERAYESITATLHGGYGQTWEARGFSVDAKAGPVLERLWTFRGPGLKNSKLLGVEGTALMTSHLFEYSASSPRDGYHLGLDFKGTAREMGSTFTVVNVKLSAEKLFLLYQNYVSDLILGFRSFYGTTFMPASPAETARIPARYRFFLGGSEDLRGFGRQELPKNGSGSFSALYLGTELRVGRIFFLEPLMFLDFGALGYDTLELQKPFYLSPGFGFRYQSPFGTLRTSLAHGRSFGGGAKNEKIEKLQFFFSFGEEF
jgi:outer membrane translocation and assembly module TamA